MSRNYNYQRGTKLMVELVHGEKFAGNVRDCDEDQITMIKVYNYLTQTEGNSNYPQHFFRIEIRNITVLEETLKAPGDVPPPTYYKRHCAEIDIMIHNFIYMTEKNEQFNSALECIKKCNVISIAALVPHFGKGINLTLLGVGTPEQVFIFDLKLIGPTAFENGLKEVLESNDILKVVHASNKLAESLSYQHDVSLRYIFDTEVADMTVSFRANSTVRPKPRYLKQCLWFYFDVPQHVTSCFYVNFMWVHSRPLTENYKMSMATQTVYLLKLKQHFEEQMTLGYNEARKYFIHFRRQGTLSDSWKMGTRKTAKRLRDFKPTALERKPPCVVARTLNVVPSQTSQATSTDDEVVKMGQALMPLSLYDEEADYDSSDSSSEMDEIIQRTLLLYENQFAVQRNIDDNSSE